MMQVLYFNAPNEDFPVLVRRVTFTNEGSDEVEIDVVDGKKSRKLRTVSN